MLSRTIVRLCARVCGRTNLLVLVRELSVNLQAAPPLRDFSGMLAERRAFDLQRRRGKPFG